MEEGRAKKVSRNIFFGLLNKIVSIIFPFITRTILIYFLGSKYLGLNSLFTSILQVLNLSELGIGSALVYNMYKPIANKDSKKVSILLNFYKKCYKTIGIIVLTIGLVLLPFIKYFINGDVPVEINVYILFLIYLTNSVISYFFFSYRRSLIIASQRNDIISKINTILIFIQNILQIMSLVLLKNYYLYIIVLPIITFLNNIIILIITNKYYPEYKPNGKIDSKELDIIKKNIKGLIFQKIGGIILSSVDSIVISMFLSIEILGVYNNYYYIISTLMGIMGTVIESIKASIGNSVAIESKEKNFKDFQKFNFMYVWIVSWFTVCFMCLAQDFIRLWIGEQYLLDNNLVIVFAIYFFTHKSCDVLYIYQDVNGLWWDNRYTQIIGAIINLMLNVILVNIIGLYGILISTIISVALVLNIGFFKVVFSKYFDKIEWKVCYLKSQLYYLLSTIIICFVMYMICNKIGFSLILFLIKIIILAIVPNILLLLLYSKKIELKESLNFIHNRFIIKKIKRGNINE